MPLDATNFHVLGPVKSVDMRQFYDLFTGGMTDQPVTFRNGLSIGGNQNVATVPLKVYGATGQTTNLIDLYVDRTAAQPGFGFSALGSFGWGPGGAAALDTFMSRIAKQNGHADDTAGILINPNLEVTGALKVTGALTAGSLNVSGGGLGTIGATRINFSPSAYIQAYGPDNSYIELPKLTVTPGDTSLASLTVNGPTQLNGTLGVAGAATLSSASVSGAVGIGSTLSVTSHIYANSNHVFFASGGAWLRYGGVPGKFDTSHAVQFPDIYTPGPLRADGALNAYGGRINFESSNQVYLQWRGDLNALYAPYGSGLYLHNMVYSHALQGGKPQAVLGHNGDSVLRWWPANAIGPPANALVFQGNISGSVAYNNMNANATTASITETFDSIGMNVESGYACRVSRAGWYAMYAVAESGTQEWDSQGGANWKCEALLDGAVQGNRFTTNTVFIVEGANGAPSRTTGWWIGFVNAGQWLGVRIWADRFGYSFSFSGKIEFTYVPVTAYPN